MRPGQYDSVSPSDGVVTRRPTVLALVIVSSVSPFAINAIVPSMPAIEEALDTSYARVQLILSLFLASIAVAQIIIGPLSDRFGRRPVLLWGFVVFVAVSAASSFAPNIETLVAMRVVQGASGCVGIVLGRAIVRDLFERRQAASMIGYVTMGLAVAPMMAPLIGGLLQDAFGWQAVFWFMTGFGMIGLAVSWAFVPETNHNPAPRLNFGTMFRDFATLLGDSNFLLFAASVGLISGVFFSFLGGVPYVSERILNLEPTVYGMWFGVMPLGYIVGNYLAGRFTEHFGVARMILFGSLVGFVAAALPLLLFAFGSIGPAQIFLPMALGGIASGIAMPSGISGAVSVRPEIAGAASGLTGAIQIGTGALLAAIAGAAVAGGGSAMPLLGLMFANAFAALLVSFAIFKRNRLGPPPRTR